MADISDLFRYAPTTAGFMLGGQLADQDKLAELTRQGKQIQNNTDQQTYDQNTQMNPLKVQQQRGINARQDAELPGLIADSSLKTQTLGSQVGAANSKNNTQIGNDQTMNYERHRRAVTEATQQIGDIQDPLQRSLLMSQIVQNHGVDPNDPLMKGIMDLAVKDPKTFLKHADEIDQRSGRNSSAYMAATDSARIQAQERDGASQREWDTRQKMNDSQIAAGRWKGKAATTVDQSIDKEGDPVKKYTMLQDMATRMQYSDPEMASHYRQRADALEAVARAKLQADQRPGTVDLPGTTQGGVRAAPPIQIAPPPIGGQPRPQPQPQPGPQSAAPVHPQAVQQLRQMIQSNPQGAQQAIAQYEQVFGPGSARTALGQ